MKPLVLALLFSLPAPALVEDFTTVDNLDTASTATWNIETHQLEIPLKVDRTQSDGNAQEDEDLLIGTGKDGAFSADTLTQFDLQGGAVASQVTLSGDRIYEFTSFHLPAGMTIKCSGTGPLRIRVQGEALIEGTIDLRGGNGAAGIGGTATCGGAAGGNGGDGGNGADGLSATTAASGGGGGGTGAGGAGGGAGHDGSGNPGGGGTGGAAGAEYDNAFIDDLLGGSGGGGGAANGGADGGGGGGGGGSLRLSTGLDLRTGAAGQILATGGNGETAAGGAGNGGGGSGGSLVLFAGRKLIHLGTIDFNQGESGSADANGRAAPGRGRLTTRETADLTGTINPGPNIPDDGRIIFSASAYEILTKPYDTGARFPIFKSLTADETLAGGTIAYEIAGSSDNFTTDDTGFVAPTALEKLEGKRYVKFRISLRGSAVDASPVVRKLTLDLEEGYQSTFRYRAAACAATHGPSDPRDALTTLLGLCYLLALPFLSRAMRSRKVASVSTVH